MSSRIDPDRMRNLSIPAAPPFMTHPGRHCSLVTDPDVFFEENADSTRRAKRICDGCPVQQTCADWADQHDQVYGVWGGVGPDERRPAIVRRCRQVAA